MADAKLDPADLRARIAQLEAENLALRARGTLLEAITGHAPVVIYAKDRQGRFLLSNPLHSELLGRTPSDVVGKRERDLLPEDVAAEIDRVAGALFETGESQSSVFDIEIEGQRRSFLELMFPIRDEHGAIVALGGISNDITDRLERQRALAASQAKSEFLAIMSHEIRTPMSALLGMTSILARTDMTDAQRELVETVHSSARSLLTILNDILDFSKIEANKLVLELAPVDVRRCLRQAVSTLGRTAADKGIALALDVAPGVPPHLITDATRLRQIVLNLVNNALKFTHAGRVDVSVSGAPLPEDRFELRVSVADTGIGIPKDRLSSLFESFSQIHVRTAHEYGGTGLGLAISKRLCEALGGRIGVESEEGRGSTFHFTIKAQVAEGVAPAAVTPAPTPGPRPALRRVSILVAEDNALNRRVIQLLLDGIGYHCDMAVSGADAIVKAHARSYDIVFMDVQMPEVDGIEAARRLRAEPPPGRRPYIIALTASAMAEDHDACFAAGMDDFLPKPVQGEDLQAAIERAYERDFRARSA